MAVKSDARKAAQIASTNISCTSTEDVN